MAHAWRPVLLSTVFLQLLGFGIVLPLLPHYGLSLGVGGAAIGALFAVYSLAQFLLAPVWGALADRVGRRPVILASLGWAVAAYLLFALAGAAGSYAVLLVSRLLAGLSAAVVGVSQAYLVDRTPEGERARGLGLLGAAFGMGFVVGPAAGALLSRWGFAVPGLAAAGLSAIAFVVAWRALPESLAPGARRSELRIGALLDFHAARAPAVRRLLGVLFLSTAGFAVLYPVLPLLLDERFGYGPSEAGLLFAGVGLAAVAVQGGAVGRLAAALGETRLLAAGALASAAGFALLAPDPGTCAAGVLRCGGGLPLLAGLAGLAAGFAVTTPVAQSLLSRAVGGVDRGRTLGLGHATASLARACGPLAGGVLHETVGGGASLWTAAALLAGAALLARGAPAAAPVGAAASSRRDAPGAAAPDAAASTPAGTPQAGAAVGGRR
ncbi:MAG TPA: MFS transporter [Gemmatimonadota bacterium]|jgi:MFS family permease